MLPLLTRDGGYNPDQPRDKQGRFASGGGKALTTAERDAIFRSAERPNGGPNSICAHCSRMTSGPRRGEKLGIIPNHNHPDPATVARAHWNHGICRRCNTKQLTALFEHHQGLSHAEAHKRAATIARAAERKARADEAAYDALHPYPPASAERAVDLLVLRARLERVQRFVSVNGATFVPEFDALHHFHGGHWIGGSGGKSTGMPDVTHVAHHAPGMSSGGGHKSGGTAKSGGAKGTLVYDAEHHVIGHIGVDGTFHPTGQHTIPSNLQEFLHREHAAIAEARANLARAKDVMSRDNYKAEISGHEWRIRQALQGHGLELGTQYKTKMTDGEFHTAFMDAFQKRVNGAGAARIRTLQNDFKTQYGMSPQEFSARMDAMRASGDRGEHSIRLHYEGDEEAVTRPGPHFAFGRRYDEVFATDLSHGIIFAYRDDPYAHTGGVNPNFRPREGNPSSVASTPRASIAQLHETAARLQREQGLPPEAKPGDALKPIAKIYDLSFDISRPIAAQDLMRIYGPDQLGNALSRYTSAQLRGIAEESHIPGIKANMSHDELVSRITAHVTGGRYSADFTRSAASLEDLHARAHAEQSARGATEARPGDPLKPIATVPGHVIDPNAPPDTHFLLQLYGDRQLGNALSEFDRASLLQTAKAEHVPGVTAKMSKEELVSRITAHATNGLFSADFSKSAGTAKATGGRTVTLPPLGTRPGDINLQVINIVPGHVFDWQGPAEPHVLMTMYGKDQLPLALDRYSASRLEAGARNIGVTPGKSKEETIARIYEKMTGEPITLVRQGSTKLAATAPTSADPARDAYLRDLARLRMKHAPYLDTHPTVATKHDAVAKEANKGTTTKVAGTSRNPGQTLLHPVALIPGYEFRPEAPPHVQALRTLYGEHQLHAALSRYSAKQLRASATFHKVTVPKKATKEQLIQLLMTDPNTQGTVPSEPLPQRATAPDLTRIQQSLAALMSAKQGAVATHRPPLAAFAALLRVAHAKPPHGADGRFYSAGTAGGKDPVARDEALHPRSAATGEHVGGRGYQLHRESEHLRESLGKLTAAGREKPELLSMATWRGHQGKNAIADHRASLEQQLKAQGRPDITAVRELQALYAIYQRRLGTPGYGATNTTANYRHIVAASSPSAARLRRESARIASYLQRYGFSAEMAGRERGAILTPAARADLTNVVDAGIAQEQAATPKPQRAIIPLSAFHRHLVALHPTTITA